MSRASFKKTLGAPLLSPVPPNHKHVAEPLHLSHYISVFVSWWTLNVSCGSAFLPFVISVKSFPLPIFLLSFSPFSPSFLPPYLHSPRPPSSSILPIYICTPSCHTHVNPRGAGGGGIKLPPPYIFRDISATVRATTLKLCIASNEYLGHI